MEVCKRKPNGFKRVYAPDLILDKRCHGLKQEQQVYIGSTLSLLHYSLTSRLLMALQAVLIDMSLLFLSLQTGPKTICHNPGLVLLESFNHCSNLYFDGLRCLFAFTHTFLEFRVLS